MEDNKCIIQLIGLTPHYISSRKPILDELYKHIEYDYRSAAQFTLEEACCLVKELLEHSSYENERYLIYKWNQKLDGGYFSIEGPIYHNKDLYEQF